MKRRTVATNWKVNLRTLAHFSSGYFFAAIDITINHVNTVPERELVAWFGRGSPLQRLVLCLFMAAVCTNLCRLIESNRNQHSLRATLAVLPAYYYSINSPNGWKGLRWMRSCHCWLIAGLAMINISRLRPQRFANLQVSFCWSSTYQPAVSILGSWFESLDNRSKPPLGSC